jgi:hypothetical protein
VGNPHYYGGKSAALEPCDRRGGSLMVTIAGDADELFNLIASGGYAADFTGLRSARSRRQRNLCSNIAPQLDDLSLQFQ